MPGYTEEGSRVCSQVLLQYMSQAVRILVTSATDATAQSVAAAGIDVGLPEEVRQLDPQKTRQNLSEFHCPNACAACSGPTSRR